MMILTLMVLSILTPYLQEEKPKNRLKRVRSDSGPTSEPPPLIRIASHDIESDEDAALDFVSLSMAGQGQRRKRVKRSSGRAVQRSSWSLDEADSSSELESDDEVEIVDEIVAAETNAVKGEEDFEDYRLSGMPYKQEHSFSKIEIIWPKFEDWPKTEKSFQNCNDTMMQPMELKNEPKIMTVHGMVPNNSVDDEVEIIDDDDVTTKMRTLEEKKRLYAMFKEKANCIIDITRARANFDVLEASGSAVQPLALEENTEDTSLDDDPENIEDNLELADGEESVQDEDDIDYIDDSDKNAENVDANERSLETPEIPMELLAEVENLNSTTPMNELEPWTGKKNTKSGGIWKKIAAIFIVNKFVEFLANKGIQVSMNGMVTAC